MKKYVLISLFLIGNIVFANNLQIVFRYDDFVLKSDSIDEGVVNIFHKNNIPLVLGIIPFDSTENIILQENYSFLTVLKKGVAQKSIEVAQHGMNHQKVIRGEFGDVDIQEQTRRIIKGKTTLDSIFETSVITFIPPWNTYDTNTLNVVSNNSFKVISAALSIGQPWSNPNLSYFPGTVENIEELMSSIEKNKNRDGIVVVLFHHYSFGSNFSLNQLDSLLVDLKKLSYVNCVTFSDLVSKNVIGDERRVAANMESNFLSKYLHLNGVLHTNNFVFIVRIGNLLLYLLVSLICYFLAAVLLFKSKIISRKITLLVGAFVLIVNGLCVWYHLFTPLKMFGAVIVISIITAIILKIVYYNVKLKR